MGNRSADWKRVVKREKELDARIKTVQREIATLRSERMELRCEAEYGPAIHAAGKRKG